MHGGGRHIVAPAGGSGACSSFFGAWTIEAGGFVTSAALNVMHAEKYRDFGFGAEGVQGRLSLW